MKRLDSSLLKNFLRLAADSLEGEWLLVGGTLLPALGLDIRSTVDIDLIGLSEKEAAQNLELMELAEKLGLAVESINQAASYFLKKVGYNKNDLLPLKKGRATIYRPSVNLFWKLKLGRLSETDYIDCLHYYNFCLANKDSVNTSGLIKSVKEQQSSHPTPEKMQRLMALRNLLE